MRKEAEYVSGYFGTTCHFDYEDGSWFQVDQLELPPGWNTTAIQILIDIPAGDPGYPSVAPKWFWMDKELRTEFNEPIGHFFLHGNGAADSHYVEKGWGHFCIYVNDWHPASGLEMAAGHSLVSYLNMIQKVFADRTLRGL